MNVIIYENIKCIKHYKVQLKAYSSRMHNTSFKYRVNKSSFCSFQILSPIVVLQNTKLKHVVYLHAIEIWHDSKEMTPFVLSRQLYSEKEILTNSTLILSKAIILPLSEMLSPKLYPPQTTNRRLIPYVTCMALN